MSKFLRIRTLAIGVGCIVGHVGLTWAAAPSPQTQAFLTATGSKALFNHNERLVALYGPPMATNPAPSPAATATEVEEYIDDFVEGFVGQHANAFGVEGAMLVPVPQDFITLRDGKLRVGRFTQRMTVAGVSRPVYGSRVIIPAFVMPDGIQRINYVGIRLTPFPEGGFAAETKDEADAIAIVRGFPEYAALEFTTPARVVYEDDDWGIRLAWEFQGSEETETYQFFVDTATGNLLGVSTLTIGADVRGTVSGYATDLTPDLCDADPPCQAPGPCDPLYPCHRADGPSNLPLHQVITGARVVLYRDPAAGCSIGDGEELDWQYAGEADCDGNPATPPELGEFCFFNVEVPLEDLRVRAELTGRWVDVRTGPSGPNKIFECDDEIEIHPASIELVFNDEPSGGFQYPDDQYETAQANCFVVSQLAHDFFKGLAPTFVGIDDEVLCTANFGHSDNAFALPWTSPPAIFFGYSSSYSSFYNAAFTTVISHEYMHVIEGALFGVEACTSKTLMEGASDIFSAFQWGTPAMFQNLHGQGSAPERDLEEVPPRQWDDPICLNHEPVCFAGPEPYQCGLAIGGSFWRARREMIEATTDPVEAIKASNELFADFMFVTDWTWDNSLLLETLIADDIDGDLTNGTPHSTEIISGFAPHGFTYTPPGDDGSVKVQWEGPDPESIEEGVDYLVYYDVEPPVVVLKTTEKDNFVVSRWRVGRVDPSSPPQNPIPWDLGVVRAEWNAPLEHDIVVEIGGELTPCASVASIDIPRQSAANWSSIELGLTGSVRHRVRCEASVSGAGGRISGNVAGAVGVIEAQAVGLGDGTEPVPPISVTLAIGGDLTEVTFKGISANKTFSGGVLRGPLIVEGGMAGTIHLDGMAFSPLNQGRVEVQGAVSGEIDIDNPTATSQLERVEIMIAQSLDGAVTVDRMPQGSNIQTGEISGNGRIEVLDGTLAMGGSIVVGTPAQHANVYGGGRINVAGQIAGQPPTLPSIAIHGDIGVGGRIQLAGGLALNQTVAVDGIIAGALEIGAPVVFGGSVSGAIIVGGSISGTISHYGVTTPTGVFDIGPLLATGKYTQTFNNPLAEWGGTLTVNGNMAGTLSFQTKLQDADLTVEGSMSGTIKTGEMYDSSIALNTVGYCSASTSGSILIGNKYTVWTPDPDTHIVNLGNIDAWGDFTSTALLKISKYQPTELISAFGTICYHRHMYGQEQVGVTNGTPPAILHCPPTGQDPCCPEC